MESKQKTKFYSYEMKYNNIKNVDNDLLMIAIASSDGFEDYITGDNLFVESNENKVPAYNHLDQKLIHVCYDVKEIDKLIAGKILAKLVTNQQLISAYKKAIDQNKKNYEIEYYKNLAEQKEREEKENLVDTLIDYFDKNYRGK